MGRRKTQKIIKTGPKNVTTGMCPECNTIGRIFIIGQVGQERANVKNAIRNLISRFYFESTHNFLRLFQFF